MRTSGKLQIDPGTLDAGNGGAEIEIVVPYTERALTAAVLQRASVLTAGLNASIRLVAIHAVPYPLPFHCRAAEHAHLEPFRRLAELLVPNSSIAWRAAALTRGSPAIPR